MGACLSRWKYSEGIGWFDLPFDMRRSIIDLMDFKTRAKFAQCSIDCYEEVAQTRNYIEEITITGYEEEEEDRWISIFLFSLKNHIWCWFRIEEFIDLDDISFESTGKFEVKWIVNDENISTTIFEKIDMIEIVLKYFNGLVKKNAKSLKSIAIRMDDFPYNRTNIKNLKCENLRELKLCKNKHGIDPILSGFVDLDTISRLEYKIEVPNLKFDDLLKIKSMYRKLTDPIFSFDDFDDFLRRLLVEEESDEQIKEIELNLNGIAIENHDILLQIISKYTVTIGLRIRNDGTSEWEDVMGYLRKSNKWKHQNHCILFRDNCFEYLMIEK
ncbi:unnamed protein product [Caenorhabditis angaria]|uniref:F-box domain-containing protein n=1 Tax=Caenorhabditis angaria TaxID=860376 RepID=A0A9P1IHV2_9PELO|nr:unnamed protein product [Caenorhabditis angaria]